MPVQGILKGAIMIIVDTMIGPASPECGQRKHAGILCDVLGEAQRSLAALSVATNIRSDSMAERDFINVTVRVPAELVERAYALMEKVEENEILSTYGRVSRNAIFRLAFVRGLEVMEGKWFALPGYLLAEVKRFKDKFDAALVPSTVVAQVFSESGLQEAVHVLVERGLRAFCQPKSE
jgi:hypothetical protein